MSLDQEAHVMSTATLAAPPLDADLQEVRSRRGTPTWEIAHLYPPQGAWTESRYLALETNQLIEFKDGTLEFLPMPTFAHQAICGFLYRLLHTFVSTRKLGWALFSPLRTRTIERFIREPDVVFVTPGDIEDRQKPLKSARLVMEVVSPGDQNRERDLVEKREEHAAAGIPEYWIVDPEHKVVEVLTLAGGVYQVHGTYRPGQHAVSALLPEFQVDVTACFKAAEGAE
jgi:Uma2 family endonuclease